MQTQNNLFSNAASNSGGADTIAKAETSATSDMFTRLLVAQIRNQDPLSPSDPSQFVNQLAQLSQTEALSKLSSLASANASVMQSMQVLALGAQVGSNVMVASDHVRLGADKVEGNIALNASSSKTTLVLTGADGVAHEVKLGALTPGNVPFSVDPVALGLAPGSYTMKVTTTTGENPPIDIAGKLNSVRLSPSGATVLNVSGVGEVEPGAVTAFNGKSAAL
jgi:flagellar basal-body rod modification protein FlgD